MPFPILPSNSASGYFLTKSLRFRSSASANLSKTWGANGSSQTFTISAWVKRGALGSTQAIVTARQNGLNNLSFRFTAANVLELYAFSGGSLVTNLITTQVFRDPSAWYHVLFAVDTTQATSTNRVKFYVNGTQITAFSTATYPSLNATTLWNQTAATHYFATYDTSSELFDGYMAEINVIDGQALTSSSFGQTSSTTGVWIPKKYGGTYGTNGFYLPFTDTTSTSTLGTDFSGNSNTWTVNNISLTSGVTYDSMLDVPTLTSATQANYCVINPLVYRNAVGQNGYSNGNLTLSGLSSAVAYFNMATVGVNASSGKFYWECQIGTASSGIYIGVTQDSNFQSGNWDAWYDSAGGVLYKGGTSFASVATATTNDVTAIAYDSTANTCAFYKNNTLLGTVTGLTSATMFPLQCARTSAVLNLNFGQRPFAYTPPTGFVALNTFNLPTPTIGATASTTANKYFNPVLWTGNGSTPRSFTGIGFAPDFAWIKSRSTAADHALIDIVRGTGSKALISNTTSAENGDGLVINSFDSDGYTLATGSFNFSYANTNAANYVSWNWKANGAGSSNTAGSITSTVSANTTAGFSIVTYTGVGGSGTTTVGHGLNVSPSMVIIKRRNSSADWATYHTGLTSTSYYLFLNSTAAQGNYGSTFISPSSSTLTIDAGSSLLNASGGTYVAYCFSAVAGYSAFGSYTGNGSNDGTFVFTGFRPRFLIVKRTNDIGSWIMTDSARSTYNVTGELFNANTSGAEFTTSDIKFDYLSNGFKLREVNGAINASGSTYIYMAFAESPFKYSNAR